MMQWETIFDNFYFTDKEKDFIKNTSEHNREIIHNHFFRACCALRLGLDTAHHDSLAAQIVLINLMDGKDVLKENIEKCTMQERKPLVKEEVSKEYEARLEKNTFKENRRFTMKTTLEERAKRYGMFIDNDSDYTKNAIKDGVILKDVSLAAKKNLSNMKDYVDKVSYTYSHALGQTVGAQISYMADDVDRELKKVNKRIDEYHGDISFTVKDKEIKVRKDVALIAAASGISVLVSLVLNKLVSRRCS